MNHYTIFLFFSPIAEQRLLAEIVSIQSSLASSDFLLLRSSRFHTACYKKKHTHTQKRRDNFAVTLRGLADSWRLDCVCEAFSFCFSIMKKPQKLLSALAPSLSNKPLETFFPNFALFPLFTHTHTSSQSPFCYYSRPLVFLFHLFLLPCVSSVCCFSLSHTVTQHPPEQSQNPKRVANQNKDYGIKVQRKKKNSSQ